MIQSHSFLVIKVLKFFIGWIQAILTTLLCCFKIFNFITESLGIFDILKRAFNSLNCNTFVCAP